MGGWKMVAARRAMARMIDTLRDDDAFALYAFDHVDKCYGIRVEQRGRAPVVRTDYGNVSCVQEGRIQPFRVRRRVVESLG